MGFRIQGLGFRVQGLGFGVWGLGCNARSLYNIHACSYIERRCAMAAINRIGRRTPRSRPARFQLSLRREAVKWENEADDVGWAVKPAPSGKNMRKIHTA